MPYRRNNIVEGDFKPFPYLVFPSEWGLKRRRRILYYTIPLPSTQFLALMKDVARKQEKISLEIFHELLRYQKIVGTPLSRPRLIIYEPYILIILKQFYFLIASHFQLFISSLRRCCVGNNEKVRPTIVMIRELSPFIILWKWITMDISRLFWTAFQTLIFISLIANSKWGNQRK